MDGCLFVGFASAKEEALRHLRRGLLKGGTHIMLSVIANICTLVGFVLQITRWIITRKTKVFE